MSFYDNESRCIYYLLSYLKHPIMSNINWAVDLGLSNLQIYKEQAFLRIIIV